MTGAAESRDTGPIAQGPSGDWPRTTRALPWMIAGFLAMIWLVPLDATTLPVHLPFDSTVDRFAVGLLGLTWILSLGSDALGTRWRSNPVNLAVAAFVVISLVSVALNVPELSRGEELRLAIKKLSLLLCYVSFFIILATSVRAREVPRFLALIVILAAITALGTIVEYRTHVNYFYNLTAHLPVVDVGSPPPNPPYGRPSIVGPTQHGLAVATILGMAVPFAVTFMLSAGSRGRRVMYGMVVILLFAGGVATLRKTALVMPVVALAVLFAYRPRQVARLVPLLIVAVVMTHVISPGALAGLRYQIEGGSKGSTAGRTSDYAAVMPDIASHPWSGRGYGTYDPVIDEVKKHPAGEHRFIDNEFLLLLIEISVFGLLAYLATTALAVRGLHRLAWRTSSIRAGPAAAIIAALVAFAVSNALFDTLSFRQVPYLYFVLLAFGVVMMGSPEGARARERAAAVDRRRRVEYGFGLGS